HAPTPADIQKLKDYKQKGCYLIGFGPRDLPALAEVVKLSDAWFDNGYGSNDAAITFLDGTHAGHGNLLGDALNAWSFMGELIASFTRHGKMPPIGKSLSYEDGLTWWNKYFKKEQFQDDFKVPPVPAGKLAHAYLEAIRGLLRKYESTQLPAVYKTADLIANELASGRKTIVADIGHMPWAYVGKDESAAWAIASNETLYSHVPSGWANYEKTTPDGALVLRLGYCGHHRDEHAVLKKKNQRVMLITAENPRPEWQLPKDLLTTIDMGWKFGDACVTIPGYPVRILPPSGVMQLVAFETVNVEVLSYLNHAAHTKAAPTPVAK
ncbi:MAG: hypothetical protein ABI254_11540, partial [Chthoniobacterales bacterium]